MTTLPVEPSRPRFLFVDEAAAQLRRSDASVRWLIQSGQIKAGKLGGRVVVSAAEIDRIIAEALQETP